MVYTKSPVTNEAGDTSNNTIKMAPNQGVAKTKSKLQNLRTKQQYNITNTLDKSHTDELFAVPTTSKQKVSYSDTLMDDPLITKASMFDNIHFNATNTIPSENYESKRNRCLTIWAPLHTQPIGVIEAIDRQFSQPLKDLILGVERDTRVRNQAKINILTKDNIGFDLFYKNGITIGQRRCYPKPLRPRPPPSKRDISQISQSLHHQKT